MGFTNLGGCPAPPFGEAAAALFSDTSFIGPQRHSWRRGGCGTAGFDTPFRLRSCAELVPIGADLPTS
jgi:hypothetical protein